MDDKPIFVECGCCGAKVEIHPHHARYIELRLQLIRELHPEVEDNEQLELSSPDTAFGMTED